MTNLRARLLRVGSFLIQSKPSREPRSFADRSMPEADKWALSEFVLECLVPIVGVHPFPVDELLLMCSTVAYFRPEVIIEWGTHYGHSARVFYEIVCHLNMPANIHSIDLPVSAVHAENTLAPDERARFVRDLSVNLHLGDGLDVATQITRQQPAWLPLFFLDGDHSRQSVLRELDGLRKIAPRAVVLVHDSFYQGSEAHYNLGPHEALAEFTGRHHLPHHSTLLGLPGMSLTYWRDVE